LGVEILLSAPHFREPNTHLRGLKIVDLHLEKIVVAVVIRYGVVLRKLQETP